MGNKPVARVSMQAEVRWDHAMLQTITGNETTVAQLEEVAGEEEKSLEIIMFLANGGTRETLRRLGTH